LNRSVRLGPCTILALGLHKVVWPAEGSVEKTVPLQVQALPAGPRSGTGIARRHVGRRSSLEALRPSTSTGEATLSGELAVLNNLFRSVALSTHEWERAKTAYLGERPDRRNESLLTLNHVYRLYQTGALSDHEFRRKKLELLTW
jgi:hypothetical protein